MKMMSWAEGVGGWGRKSWSVGWEDAQDTRLLGREDSLASPRGSSEGSRLPPTKTSRNIWGNLI